MSNLLGSIVWYQVSSGGSDSPLGITRDDLIKLFEELGLNQEFLPPPIKGVDAFRTASALITDSYSTGAERVKLHVQEVRKTGAAVVRHLIRTGTAVSGGKVNSSRVAEIQFVRPKRMNVGRVHGTETVEVYPHSALEGIDREHVLAALGQFEKRYELFRQQLTPAAMRYVIRNYLIYLDAIPIPAGSSWFLPNDREAEVRALQTMTRRLGPQCAFDVIPLLDTAELREMLLKNIEEAVVGQAVQVTKMITEWMADNPGRKMPIAKFNALRTDVRGISARTEEYGRLLEAPLPQSADALASVLRTLQGLELATELG